MWHDIDQNSDEWFLLRAGKVTASSLNKVMANYGKAFGEPAKKYAAEIALQQIYNVPSGGGYTNDHMARGHEEEPLARMEYESDYFCSVTNGGFYEDGDMGTSPDGLVGSNGMIEIKSALPSIHYARISKQSFDSAYKWQLVGHLKISGRDWVDFVSYCSSFPPDKKLYVHRSTPDDFKEEFKMVDERMEEFRKLIEQSKEIILNSSYSITGEK
jgi:hypothetical protein